MSKSRAKLASDAQALTRTEDLLLRYPQVTADEVQEIGQYLRRASAMDIGLLSSNHEAWSKAEQYRRDHPAVFATTKKEKVIWTVATIAVVALLVMLWDLGLAT